MVVTRLRLRDFRSYAVRRGRAGRAAHRRPRAQRRRQDEPPRGAVLRLHRALVPHDQRARAGALRRGRSPARVVRVEVHGRDRDGEHELSVGFQPGEAEALQGRRRAGRAPARRTAPPAGQRLPARPAGAREGAAGAAALAPRPGRRGAVAGAGGHAPRSTGRCSRSATRCWRACAPAARARRSRRGTSSSRATASPCATTVPPRWTSCARASPRPPTSSGSPAPRSCATARARGRTAAEALAAELAERLDADLERGFTTHGPHRDDVALLRDGRELRAYGSQGEQRMGLLALLLAERAVLEDERGAPPLLLLDDVMSELDFGRRERLVERLRVGQALVTTTDVAHVPGRRRGRRRAPARRRRRRYPDRSHPPSPSTAHEAPRAQSALARHRRARRSAGAADHAGRGPARVARRGGRGRSPPRPSPPASATACSR